MEGSNGVLSHPVAAADNLSSSGFTSRAVNSTPKVLSNPISNLSSGFFPADKVSRAYRNFKRSAAPSRFLLFSQNAWVNLDHQVFDQLLEGFLAGKTAFEAAVDGNPYHFDFLSMSRTDPSTGRQNSLAWIDVHGRCFFPADERGDPGLRINTSFSKPPQQQNPPLLLETMEEVSSDRWPETKSLRDDEKFYKTVEKLFLSSMKRFSPGTTITSIHRCLHSTPSGNSRLLSFELQKRAAMEARGNANVKFGWHGTSSSSIATIISQGFGKTNSGQLGLSSHGLGIHLSPPHSPFASALLSEADEDGERHVMLCRIIMGNSEKVEAGSNQDHPSNEGFDSGVDDPVNPKWYVVWNTNMNTHIIPEYVVSFKSSSHSPGPRKPMGAQKLSNRPLWKLFTEIGMRLPSSKMQALEILYNQYKVGKFSKEVFIRYMRSVAGDQLLTSSINKLRNQFQVVKSTFHAVVESRVEVRIITMLEESQFGLKVVESTFLEAFYRDWNVLGFIQNIHEVCCGGSAIDLFDEQIKGLLMPARTPQTAPEEATTATVVAEPSPSTFATRTARKTTAVVEAVNEIFI